MAVKKHKALIQSLKKKVRILQRREEKARNQMRTALKKAHKLGKHYKSKLSGKVRSMKSKVAAVQAATYAKAAIDLERKLIRGIKAKGKALASAVAKIEKKHAARLTKSIASKGKKRKARKTMRPAKRAKRSAKK